MNPDEVVASDPQNERYFKAWAKPNAELSSSGTRDAAAVADIARVAIANANAGASRPVLDPQVLTLWEKASSERDALAQKLAEMAQKTDALSHGADCHVPGVATILLLFDFGGERGLFPPASQLSLLAGPYLSKSAPVHKNTTYAVFA